MINFRQFGGRPSVPVRFGLANLNSIDPNDIIWNFGLVQTPPEVVNLIKAHPSFHQKFPKFKGAWDGKTTINHWDAVRAVLGSNAETLIQNQPRGTCGGRAGSAGCDIVQCVLIAGGKRAKFKRASHAFLYWQARKKYGMDNGSPGDEGNDGVAGGSIPEVMTEVGLDTRDETQDTKWYGAGSDDLACKWGAGKIEPSLANQLEQFARDNVVADWAPVRSAAELADGIAAGGVGIGSDMQGFSMSRDSEGFCSGQGTWAHYQVRCSVFVSPRGRKGFGYYQSWGRDVPDGPILPGHPGNCFGVEWNLQDRIIKSGEWAVVFGFPLFEQDYVPEDLPWVFANRPTVG